MQIRENRALWLENRARWLENRALILSIDLKNLKAANLNIVELESFRVIWRYAFGCFIELLREIAAN